MSSFSCFRALSQIGWQRKMRNKSRDQHLRIKQLESLFGCPIIGGCKLVITSPEPGLLTPESATLSQTSIYTTCCKYARNVTRNRHSSPDYFQFTEPQFFVLSPWSILYQCLFARGTSYIWETDGPAHKLQSWGGPQSN